MPTEGFTTQNIDNSADHTNRPHMPTEYDQYFEDSAGKTHRVREAPEVFSALMAPSDDSMPDNSLKVGTGAHTFRLGWSVLQYRGTHFVTT